VTDKETTDMVSYTVYFRLTPRHKWRLGCEGYGPKDTTKLAAFYRYLLRAYHKEGTLASYVIVLKKYDSGWPPLSLWDAQVWDIPENERTFVRATD